MHDLWVACPASCPHKRPFLHPLLHSPGGASLHLPRTRSNRKRPTLFLAQASAEINSVHRSTRSHCIRCVIKEAGSSDNCALNLPRGKTLQNTLTRHSTVVVVVERFQGQ